MYFWHWNKSSAREKGFVNELIRSWCREVIEYYKINWNNYILKGLV